MKIYWRVKEYWRGAIDRILLAAILMVVLIPSYFIVIWIFPGLDFHPETRGSFRTFAALYAFALFAATAIVAVILFVVGAKLKKTITAIFARNDTLAGK